MTREKILKRAEKIYDLVGRFYKKDGPRVVRERLKKIGIRVPITTIKGYAQRLEVRHRDPKTTKIMYEVVLHKYASLGMKGTWQYLKDVHGITVHPQTIKDAASRLGIRRKKKKEEVKPPKLETHKFPEPPALEISREAWEKPGVRVGGLSRIDWKDKGTRAGLVRLAFEKVFVSKGCHYNGLSGGLVSKKDISARIQKEKDALTPAQRRRYSGMVVEHILDEFARELHSILPFVRKPQTPDQTGQVEFIRLYIMTSRILDGDYGERVARRLQNIRPDIRLYKQGGARTRLKGVGTTEEERHIGQMLGWLNPKKSRLSGQYASTAVDADVREEEAATESYPLAWITAGYGSSTSKPGGGEKKRPRISLPVCSVPIPRREGDPAVALNQIGVRVIEVSPEGEMLIQTWSFRDLVKDERTYVTGIKDGATELHKKIVEAIAKDTERQGLHIGELSDRLEIPRDEIEQAIQFLIEPRALKRTTWPGLYKDSESGLFNFHLDWFQERLRYPWPYDKDYLELKRLLFGCLHAGYNTTDYEFVRHCFLEIIERFGIEVVELIGDITAGLKHHLIHRGQIIGNLNYTEQETLAAELLGTVFYEVFTRRFEKLVVGKGDQKIIQEELEELIKLALVLFLYIVGNHEAWQKELGYTPGVVFRAKLVALLNHHIGRFLVERGFFTVRLDEIIRSKIIELPEYNAVYSFPGGICTELLHPSMSRTKTASIRTEEAFDFSRCQLVDIANFHTTFEQEKWDPELRQRVAAQAGAMTPLTYFEHGKLKRVDFGPIYVGVRYRDGRIFMSEHQFFHKPILKEPINKDTDINQLKERLRLLRSPA